jgi:sugar-specific transcriptional regulator TrmB
MVLHRENEITVLVELGLTNSQAKVYLALVQIGSSKIGNISKTTGILRENLYQTIRSLENAGLVEKELGAANKYKAISPDEALSMLLRYKQKQVNELKTKTKTMMENLKKESGSRATLIEDLQTIEDSKFVIISGKDVLIKKIKDILQKSQSDIDIVTSLTRFSSIIAEFAKDYRKALGRGAKIRIAIEKHVAEKGALDKVFSLKRNPRFEAKYFSEPPQAILWIFDQKEAFVSLSATANLNETLGIWSNNSSFVALARNYFETQWNNSLEELQVPEKQNS